MTHVDGWHELPLGAAPFDAVPDQRSASLRCLRTPSPAAAAIPGEAAAPATTHAATAAIRASRESDPPANAPPEDRRPCLLLPERHGPETRPPARTARVSALPRRGMRPQEGDGRSSYDPGRLRGGDSARLRRAGRS